MSKRHCPLLTAFPRNDNLSSPETFLSPLQVCLCLSTEGNWFSSVATSLITVVTRNLRSVKMAPLAAKNTLRPTLPHYASPFFRFQKKSPSKLSRGKLCHLPWLICPAGVYQLNHIRCRVIKTQAFTDSTNSTSELSGRQHDWRSCVDGCLPTSPQALSMVFVVEDIAQSSSWKSVWIVWIGIFLAISGYFWFREEDFWFERNIFRPFFQRTVRLFFKSIPVHFLKMWALFRLG